MPSLRQRSANQYRCRWYIGYEHALHRDNEILTIRRDRKQEFVRPGPKILVEDGLAVPIEDVDVHRLLVQVDAAVIGVLTVVEIDHGASSWSFVLEN